MHKENNKQAEDDGYNIIFRRSYWSKKLNRRVYSTGKPFPIKIRKSLTT